MKHKIFILFMTFLILLSSCVRKRAYLTFAVGGAPNEVDYWQKLIKEFEDSTHIPVKLLRQPTDTDQRRQSLVNALKAKENDPDVFLMDVAWVGQFSASHYLLSLNNYIRKDRVDTNNFFSPVLHQVDIFHHNIIALPVYLDCGLLYFRKDLLKKYGCSIPETWEDLIECAEKIQKGERKKNPEFYGFVWQGAQYEGLICDFIEFISSNGGGILDKKGNIVINNKENVQALKFMRALINKYKISPPNTYTEMKEEEVRISFQNGNALFERNWPYAWKLHESENSPVRNKIGVAVLPKFNGKRHASTLGGWHIGISRYSDNPEDAWKLVKFILSYPIQKKLALNLGWNPGRKDIYDDPDVKRKMPHIKVLKSALKYAVARPSIPYYTQISSILQRYVNAAISGRIKPEKALQGAQKEIEKLVNAYTQ